MTTFHMCREHLAGKMGNANNNAFKLRKLFKMYDATGSGKVCCRLTGQVIECFNTT